jgi:hypothetical protein
LREGSARAAARGDAAELVHKGVGAARPDNPSHHTPTFISQHSLLQHAIEASSKDPDRYSSAEIKWIACLPVAKLHKQLDDVAKKIRELNLAIQQANWEIDLE